MKINITRTSFPKPKPEGELGFGKYFTDHMLTMEYSGGNGWWEPAISPYGNLSLDPASMVFHYGQEIFEGLKAYKAGNDILLFRPDANARRMNASAQRLCMPAIDVDMWVDCVKEIVRADADWIPTAEGTSLYIRPFMIATDPFVGVRASNTYKLIIILSPVGAYYPEGLDPVKIYVEGNYSRAVRGGTGQTKSGGNYAASIIAQQEAKARNYTQVLWLDAVERKYIEEVGTMNVFFVIGDTVVTPSLSGSILPGITRDSCLAILKSWGIKCEERRISIDEVRDAQNNGSLKEVFGTGTAAVISPVGELCIVEDRLKIADGGIGELSQRLYDELTGIQLGRIPDRFGWTMRL